MKAYFALLVVCLLPMICSARWKCLLTHSLCVKQCHLRCLEERRMGLACTRRRMHTCQFLCRPAYLKCALATLNERTMKKRK